jgi:hypothetical protein
MKLFPLLLLLPFFNQAQGVVNRQPFPQQQINELMQKVWENKNNEQPAVNVPEGTANTNPSGIAYLLQQQHHLLAPSVKERSTSTLKSLDTLWVGLTPNDTVTITGNYQVNGPVIVENDGVLIFENAYATILGDVLVPGGQIIATNSTLYIPQTYFYERAIIVDGNGQVYMRHCTLNFGGITHSMGMGHNATMTFQNVYFTDFSTIGLNGAARLIADSVNVLGEVVNGDSTYLSVNHTDTVILWHHVPAGDSLTWSFPSGINVAHYGFGPDSAGVVGLKFNIDVNNTKLVEWALMPDNGSFISISNSTVQSVGAIFRGRDSGTVQGLVNKSYYSSASSFFTDRTFQLTNSTVECWSLYPTDTTKIRITGCITGEIGSNIWASTSCVNTFNDGTGGYFWSAGNSVQTASECAFTCAVRSEGTSYLFAAFCSISASPGEAIDSSILFLIQTPLIYQPVAYDGSDVWVATLQPVNNAYAGQNVPIIGSAYILRGPISHLMSFASYYVAWQVTGDTTWTMMDTLSTTPVNQSALTNWNTTGLAPGNYNLIMVIKDNFGDSVVVNSSATLLPGVLNGISDIQNGDLKVFPNPATNQLTISSNQLPVKQVCLINMMGQTVFTYNCGVANENTPLNIDISNVPAGVYIYQITTENEGVVEGKMVKM